MSRLLIKAAVGHFKRHPLQGAFAVVGVALGVAVFVGIEGANGSALRAFEASAEAITGRTTHQIVAESAGVPEELYRVLRLEHGVRWSAPVVEGFVSLLSEGNDAGNSGRSRFRLIGVDPFVESGFRQRLAPGVSSFDLAAFLTRPSVVLSSTAAAELGVRRASKLEILVAGVTRTVEVAGTFEPGNDFDRQAAADLMVTDVATAQVFLGLGDRLSRIDLMVPSAHAGDSAPLEAIRPLLPPGVRIVRPEQRSAAAEQMTRAFRLNLRALSLLALLCGAFLIYNTMTFAVVQRRGTLGTLRALGATSRELFVVILSEAAIVGILGSAIGILMGHALAGFLVSRVAQTINDLYFVVSVREVTTPTAVLVAGGVLGVGAALVAALGPAVEALRATPRAALDRVELEHRTRNLVPWMSTVGVVLALGGAGALGLRSNGLHLSFAGLFMVLLGLACLTPATTLALIRLLTPGIAMLFGSLGRLSARGVVAALSRTGIAVAALMMAVAVTVGVDVMIRSFRGTVDRWLAYSLPADLYVTSPAAFSDKFSASPSVLDDSQISLLRALEGVGTVTTVRTVRVDSELGSVRLLAHDLGSVGHGAFRLASGDPVSAWTAYDRGTAVLVSEPFAFRHAVGVGDTLGLETPSGRRDLAIAGVFYDYTTEEGTVLLAQREYRRLWGDHGLTAAAIYVGDQGDAARRAPAPPSEIESIVSAARKILGSGFVIRSNGLLREQSLRVFDRTFVVTGVLRLLAVLVAFVGILAALTALQLERGRELGVLRAIGLTPREIWALVTTQTGLIGLVAGTLSIPVGLVMSTVMIHVINRRSFGWSLDMTVSPEPLISAIALSVAAALLAGLYPAYRMSRTSPAEALRAE